MTDPFPPVRLILDRSALLAYVAGSVDAAETIGEVIRDGVRFGVPAVVAAEAVALVDDNHDRVVLRRLLTSEACVTLGADGDAWEELAFWRRSTGRIDTAAAVMAALDHEAWLLTGEAKPYDDGLSVIELPDHPAGGMR
jgi:hypothetical protein